MTTFSLTPLMRHAVGFNRLNNLFDNLYKIDESANPYPPYNIEKRGDDNYVITMAVAGFSLQDLNLIVEGDVLRVRGRIEEKATDAARAYLHKGIANRAFERRFNLADHVEVRGANLKNGLLEIELKRVIPETQKPRMIEIREENQSIQTLKQK